MRTPEQVDFPAGADDLAYGLRRRLADPRDELKEEKEESDGKQKEFWESRGRETWKSMRRPCVHEKKHSSPASTSRARESIR